MKGRKTMDEIKRVLAPLTDALPPGVRDFLDGGGWWVVAGVVGVVVLLLLWAVLDRLLRALFGRRQSIPENSDADLYEHLADYPPLSQPPGSRRLTLYHLPVRLRLVVVAPVGTETPVDGNAIPQLLDRIIPGLGAAAVLEQARIRLWPPQLSQQGFTAAFHRCTHRPEPDGEPSNWILASGKAQIGRQAVLVGLGLWTSEPNTIGRVSVDTYQWLDVLRIKELE
jgi:hypothetical protein